MKNIFLFVIFILLFSCVEQKPIHEGLDVILQKYDKSKELTAILYDFNEDPSGYQHRYKILYKQDSALKEEITGWMSVSEEFYLSHINDMGMELASKTDGKLTKKVAPAGMTQYVNNPQYGHYTTNSDGESFWEFYGQYAMLKSLTHEPYNQTVIHHYNTTSRTLSTPYYGDGKRVYGTNNPTTMKKLETTRPSFKQKVQSRVSSSSSTKSTSWGSSKSSSTSKPSAGSRSSSSSNSSSSSRSSSSGSRSSSSSRRK